MYIITLTVLKYLKSRKAFINIYVYLKHKFQSTVKWQYNKINNFIV